MFDNKIFEFGNILFIIVPIFIGIVFIFTIIMFISPKLRGKFMSHQFKALKHMTDYSKDDIHDIASNLGDVSVKIKKTVLDNNEETLKDIYTREANIEKDAIKIKTRAIKEGFGDNKIYCKYCGSAIDEDSIYCKECGKKQ